MSNRVGLGMAAGAVALGGAWYLTREGPAGKPTNSAFVFVKPHAVTDKANQLVHDRLVS
eukprot:CAMPEP_0195101440 /NCGR_PEP_ID=MMETSP0448-20130528/65111_1 /TAXON_ID=66468 /ORGANISM="Heterocapsa triquestra, Strain CCMP 448" /LENGTH=58 /DNA_ID=CAMNT_0040136743 /DNA_START=61 /DNA_END=234 /DNA_ORIENTATION=+